MGNAGGRGGKDRVAEKAKKAAAAKSKKETKIKQKGATGKAAAGDETEDVPNLAFEEPEKPPFQLRDVDISIPRGGLTCVVGTIGSGKVRPLAVPLCPRAARRLTRLPSFLRAPTVVPAPGAHWRDEARVRLGCLWRLDRVRRPGALGPELQPPRQHPVWQGVRRGALRERHQGARPSRALASRRRPIPALSDTPLPPSQACALETDLEILPNGLETEIGEKGAFPPLSARVEPS